MLGAGAHSDYGLLTLLATVGENARLLRALVVANRSFGGGFDVATSDVLSRQTIFNILRLSVTVDRSGASHSWSFVASCTHVCGLSPVTPFAAVSDFRLICAVAVAVGSR